MRKSGNLTGLMVEIPSKNRHVIEQAEDINYRVLPRDKLQEIYQDTDAS
jgi:hypothetical protein